MELTEAIERSRVDNVCLRRGGRSQRGSLALTSHHVIFSPRADTDKPVAVAVSGNELWMLHRAVDRSVAEAKSRDKTTNGGVLTLKMKNFSIFTFDFEVFDDCAAVARSLEVLSNLTDIRLEYPFFYHCSFAVLEDGWSAFATEQEYARLQVHSDFWRISCVNMDFQVCESYPQTLVVPRDVPDEVLCASAKFRDGGRFPVLAYYHRETRSSIVRCSQPLVGGANRRSRDDEALLNALLGAAARGYIIDTRSTALAQAAKTKGGGFEQEMFYRQWKRVHRPVPTATQLRDALSRLVEACNDDGLSTDRWLSRLNGSGWLQHVTDALTCACLVAQCVDREGETTGSYDASFRASEVPVVVHGGASRDGTLLVTALAELLLDADARTVRGMQSLVERAFVRAGHPFWLRCAHAAYATGHQTGPHEGPVFLLFLDCVWQIYQQFPCSFEFNEDVLLLLFEHSHASEFGTFLGNCEKDKVVNEVRSKTTSFWSYLNRPEILQTYVNPLYEPNGAPIWPSVAPQSLVLWERAFLRWTRDFSHQDRVYESVVQWKAREQDLISKVVKMRRQLVELEREAQQSVPSQ